MAKITKRIIDSVELKPERYYIWDSELKGFGVKVEPSGTKTYILRYRTGNSASAPRRFISIGRHGALTPDMARNEAIKLLGSVATGNDPALEKAKANSNQTVKQVEQVFLEFHVKSKRKKRTAIDYSSIIHKYIIPKFGSQFINQINRSGLEN
jgi:hypothetical protein